MNAGVDAAAVQAAEPRSDAPLRILLTRRTQRDRIIGVQQIFASWDICRRRISTARSAKPRSPPSRTSKRRTACAETGAFNDELVKKVYEVAGKGEPPAGHLYVRQDFDDVFDTAGQLPQCGRAARHACLYGAKFRPRRHQSQWVTLDVQDGAELRPLDRLEIPDDFRQKISERLTPGSTFIVADTSINSANLPKGGDFVVLAKSTSAKISMTDETRGKPKPRRRNNALVRRFYDDPGEAAPGPAATVPSLGAVPGRPNTQRRTAFDSGRPATDLAGRLVLSFEPRRLRLLLINLPMPR